MTHQARFESKVELDPVSGCWLWLAATDEKGYGRFGLDGKNHRAHRVSYELYVGPIPDGAHVLHRCDTPPCVRPDDLFLGDAHANMLDCAAKGRHPQGKKTHCPQGHLYDEANTLVSGGRRHCRVCGREQNREWYRLQPSRPSYRSGLRGKRVA